MSVNQQRNEIIVPRGGLRGARLPLIFLLPMAFLTFWVVRAHLNGEVPPEDGIGLPLLLGGISGVLAIASLDAAVRWGRIAVADGALQVTEHRLAWTRRLDFPIDEVVEVCAQMEDNGDIQRCRLCVKTLADERIVFAELPRQVVEQLADEANRLCQAATASGECAQSPSVTVSWVQFMQGMFVVAATFALVVAISHFMSRIYTLEFVRDSTSRVRLAAEHRILLVPAGTTTIEHPYILGEPQLVDELERRVSFRGEQGTGDYVMSDSQLAKVQAFLSSDESGRLRFTVGNPLAELAAWIFASATGFMLVCVLGSIPSLTNRRRNQWCSASAIEISNEHLQRRGPTTIALAGLPWVEIRQWRPGSILELYQGPPQVIRYAMGAVGLILFSPICYLLFKLFLAERAALPSTVWATLAIVAALAPSYLMQRRLLLRWPTRHVKIDFVERQVYCHNGRTATTTALRLERQLVVRTIDPKNDSIHPGVSLAGDNRLQRLVMLNGDEPVALLDSSAVANTPLYAEVGTRSLRKIAIALSEALDCPLTFPGTPSTSSN